MEHVGSKLMDNVTNGENMGASILPNTPFEIQVDDVTTGEGKLFHGCVGESSAENDVIFIPYENNASVILGDNDATFSEINPCVQVLATLHGSMHVEIEPTNSIPNGGASVVGIVGPRKWKKRARAHRSPSPILARTHGKRPLAACIDVAPQDDEVFRREMKQNTRIVIADGPRSMEAAEQPRWAQ